MYGTPNSLFLLFFLSALVAFSYCLKTQEIDEDMFLCTLYIF
jgi:hypothetical protein